MIKFQPISEAPKDGTRVLLYGGYTDDMKTSDTIDVSESLMLARWRTRSGGDDDYWHVGLVEGGCVAISYQNPTHFAYIPELLFERE